MWYCFLLETERKEGRDTSSSSRNVNHTGDLETSTS